jgi:hypothetical protein
MHEKVYSSQAAGKAADYITNDAIIGVLWAPLNNSNMGQQRL